MSAVAMFIQGYTEDSRQDNQVTKKGIKGIQIGKGKTIFIWR